MIWRQQCRKKRIQQKQSQEVSHTQKVVEKLVIERQIRDLFVFVKLQYVLRMFSCCKGYNVRIGILNIFEMSIQGKGSVFCSVRRSIKEENCFLAKTCSSTHLSSLEANHEEPEEVNYSKMLKQRDLRILGLSEKLKAAQIELAHCRSSHSGMHGELIFFKGKLQQEFYRSVCLESEVDLLASRLQSAVLKVVDLLANSTPSLQSFTAHLQTLNQRQREGNRLEIAKQLLGSLEFQISQLSRNFGPLPSGGSLVRSAKLTSGRDKIEKEVLRDHISQLVDFYETKLRDSDDYQQEVQNLRRQREYIKGLLLSSEKEKNSYVNQVYQLARKQFCVDFQVMGKAQVVKLAIGLLSRLRDLDVEKQALQKQLCLLQTTEKDKYDQMLKLVKKISRSPQNRISLRRMASMPAQ